MEAWYLNSLITWTDRMKRAPTLSELAGWLKKSRTAVHSALVSLEHKGWVTRTGCDGPVKHRRFAAVPQ